MHLSLLDFLSTLLGLRYLGYFIICKFFFQLDFFDFEMKKKKENLTSCLAMSCISMHIIVCVIWRISLLDSLHISSMACYDIHTYHNTNILCSWF